MPYDWVNPYAFSPPIAPHIAAREAGVEISLDLIRERADALAAQADCLIVEGVGGWRVPLGPVWRSATCPGPWACRLSWSSACASAVSTMPC